MKKIVNKINVAVIAVLLGVGLIAVQSAFKPAEQKRTDTYWKFNSNDEALARSGFQYSQILGDPDLEVCDTGNDMPCVISAPSGTSSQTDLNDYLQDHYDTPEEVTLDAYATKVEAP